MATSRKTAASSASQLSLDDPMVRMALLAGGGALAVLLAPSILKGTLRFAGRTAVDIAIKAVPIVIAGLLAKEGAEKLESA